MPSQGSPCPSTGPYSRDRTSPSTMPPTMAPPLDGSDFTAQAGTITFNSTSTSFDIDVPITDDSVIEPTEAFTVTLSNVQSNIGVGILGPDTANGTINDDDATGSGVAVRCHLRHRKGGDRCLRKVHRVLQRGHTAGTGRHRRLCHQRWHRHSTAATSPHRRAPLPSTVPSTSFDIDVPITDDSVIEPTEAFTVTLSNVQSNIGVGILGPDTANGTINDDDATGSGVAFDATSVTVREGTDAFARFTVSFNGAIQPGQDVTVDYGTNDGTATDGSDFTAQAGTITFNSTSHLVRYRCAHYRRFRHRAHGGLYRNTVQRTVKHRCGDPWTGHRKRHHKRR